MSRFWISVLICVAFAALEGVLAGRGVKERFAELRFPRYSLPLLFWYIVGALYYAMCFVIVFRLLGNGTPNSVRMGARILVVVMMAANAGWNYLFFRARNLFAGFVLSGLYTLVAVTLFFCLLGIDRIGAWTLLPYILYLGYANLWGYRVWKLNV